MFIRLKGTKAEINVALSQVRYFEPSDSGGSLITFVNDDVLEVKESNRVIRKLISEAGTPASEAE